MNNNLVQHQLSVEGIWEPQKNPLSLRERVRVREIKY
jgi:hypothetical protein